MFTPRNASTAARAVLRAQQMCNKSTAAATAGRRMVNDVHTSDLRSLPELNKKDNACKPVSASHWDDSWDAATLQKARDDHVMASWAPTNALQGAPNIVRAEGVYLYDDNGKQYLDWTSQAVCMNFGHTIPPQVKAAIDKQLDTLPYVYSGLGNSEIRTRLAQLLSEIAPGNISGFLFPSGGGEANEAAIRIARRYTGRNKIINHYRSYHGGTTSSLAATGDFRRWFAEAGATGFIKTFNPSPFHFNMGESIEEAGENALRMLEEQILMEGPESVAAIMMESIIGAGGVFVFPENYMQGVRALCDKYGIMLILDEVMVGFARSGKMWGFQHYEGVVPDIMTSAKGLTGSFLPLAMVGVSEPIKQHFNTNPLGWGATYHAHPVSLACAYECIKHLVKEDFPGQVQAIEPTFIAGLQRLLDEHPSVHQARGVGLFGCIEFVNKEGHLTQPLQGPMTPRNMEFKKALSDEGIYGLLRLPLLHCSPPLNITEAELNDGFERLHRAIAVLDKDFE